MSWDVVYHRSNKCSLHKLLYKTRNCKFFMIHFTFLLISRLPWCGTHNSVTFTTQSRLLTTRKKKAFENILGKGENAGNQHFLLFPKCFLPFPKQMLIFESHLLCHLQMLSIWSSRSKNLLYGKELTLYHTIPVFLFFWTLGKRLKFNNLRGKRRKYWKPALSLLPTIFSTPCNTILMFWVTSR